MLMNTLRWRMLAGFVCVLFLATACFRQVGDEAQGNVVSDAVPTGTATASPSPPQPTASPTQTATPTTTVTEVGNLDQPASDLATPLETRVAQSNGAEGFATSTPESDEIQLDVDQQPPQQEDEPADEFVLTATVIVREVTETAAAPLTLTAAASGPIATETLTETPTLPGIPATATLSGANCIHEVSRGENLFRLSLRYGLTVGEIAADNNITNINLISVGEKLTIRGCGTTGVLPPPTSIPTPTFAFGTGGSTVPNPSTGDAVNPNVPTNTCGSTIVVQQFETLFQISLRCNVPVQSIANANGISNINFIKIGDVLNIPPN